MLYGTYGISCVLGSQKGSTKRSWTKRGSNFKNMQKHGEVKLKEGVDLSIKKAMVFFTLTGPWFKTRMVCSVQHVARQAWGESTGKGLGNIPKHGRFTAVFHMRTHKSQAMLQDRSHARIAVSCCAEIRAFSAKSVLKTSSTQAKAMDGFVRTLRVSSCAPCQVFNVRVKRAFKKPQPAEWETHQKFYVFKSWVQPSAVPVMLSKGKRVRNCMYLPKKTLIIVPKRNLHCIIRCPNELILGSENGLYILKFRKQDDSWKYS